MPIFNDIITSVKRASAFLFLAAAVFISCSKEEIKERPSGGDIDITLPDEPVEGDDSGVDIRLGEVINLGYPGLEKVKEAWNAGNYYQAAWNLREYYRERTDVRNPLVDLITTTISESDLNIADQATKENGYRFYVKNYQEGTDPATGLPLYWSFSDGNGGIDWEFVPKGLTEKQFLIQKHRHQWMEPQAKAYWVTKDEKYILAWIDVYSDWLETYPCPGGTIPSTNPVKDMWTDLQATSRTMDQINMLQYFIRSENFTPEWLSTFLVAFHDCVESIRANYYHTFTSNHRLFEVQAVFYAGVMMPEFVKAPEWEQEATSDLLRELDVQFLEDGMQNELDPSYHLAVFNIFHDIYSVAQANGRLSSLPSDFMERLHKPADFARDIMFPDYSVEKFNDTRVVASSYLVRNFKEFAEMFPQDKSFEWFATKGKSGSAPDWLMAAYPYSGWYMFRNGWTSASTMLVLKNNNNPNNWWHCQPDNGHIALYRNGRRFLPDAGVFTYGGSDADNAVRDSYRATSSHNTMTRSGATIADGRMLGEGLLYGEASVQDGAGDASGSGTMFCTGAEVCDAAVVQNPSYSDLTHRRSVFFVNREFFVIVDEGFGSGSGFPVELSFHLCDPLGSVTIDSYQSGIYGAHTTFTDGNNMLFKTFCETTTGFKTESGTSKQSDAIGESVDRKYYRVSTTKPSGAASRHITVIHPLGSTSAFQSLADGISAQFLDQSPAGTPDSMKCQVTVSGRTFVLGYAL
ncbi:MAG: alginate lyase family protein [Candidatus Cryptobacteroides sp.]